MGDPLNGVRLKVRRAEHHLDALKSGVQQFIDSNPYSFFGQQDAYPLNYVIRAKINHHPPIEWSAIVGDFAHNARAALNMIAYEASTLPIEKRYSIQFPVFDLEEKYLSAKERILGGVSTDHRALMERYQPYKRRDAFANDPLGILAHINDTDKHRAIQVVGVASNFTGISFIRPVSFGGVTIGPGVTIGAGVGIGVRDGVPSFHIETVNGGMVSEDGAVVARVTIPRGAQMQMQPHAAIRIQFAEGSERAQGHPVLDTLAFVLNRVKEVVADFEKEFAQG